MGNREWGMGMEYFPPKQGDLASVVASLIKRLADRPNITYRRHPGEVAVAKLTFVKFVNGVWGTGNSEFRKGNGGCCIKSSRSNVDIRRQTSKD